MSSIYIQEPPTHGKVCLETTVGDIEIELFSRECPKACRNFVQLCMENYYDKTKFHRVVKEFIVQGGDPTGTGHGGESIYGNPFKDEFHTRLRFSRRGLVGMANAGKDDNGSQFFFTLGDASELQNKHTLFGKVVGDTIFNMIKLGDGHVENERPSQPHKILKTKVLINPFPDIEPRQLIQMLSDTDDLKKKEKAKSKMNATKDFKLLSFGDEAEEEETFTPSENKFKSKSSHDLLNDPKLSRDVGSEFEKVQEQPKSLDVEAVRSKLSKKSDKDKSLPLKAKIDRQPESKKPANTKSVDDVDIIYESSDEDDERLRIQKEIKALKKDLRAPKKKDEPIDEDKSSKSKRHEADEKNNILKAFHEEQDKYSQLSKSKVPKKGSAREEMTLALLNKFTSKLRSVNESQSEEPDAKKSRTENDNDDDIVGDDWLGHTLKFENDDPILAKDANTKGDDWFDIFDPRNPLAKRRREQSKKDKKQKK